VHLADELADRGHAHTAEGSNIPAGELQDQHLLKSFRQVDALECIFDEPSAALKLARKPLLALLS
jgi:hypothetical protein